MSQVATSSRSFGTFTVLDIMLFVAACSVSILLIRLLRPPAPTWEDYLLLTAYCGPAGLSVFGPWAVRRQFVDSQREELHTGEWLWIALGGGWIAAAPLMLAAGGKGVRFFTSLVAVFVLVPGAIALVQSLPYARRRPWTHWAGIALCLLHAAPALVEVGPFLWDWADAVFQAVAYGIYA
jgi:hypothetical protein